MALHLLISPLARGAYFGDVLSVAREELALVMPGVEAEASTHGGLTVLTVPEEVASLRDLARLSFVQGVFRDEGEGWIPLDADPAFGLPDALVFGAKYPGKTHELATQLAINTALAHAELPEDGPVKLLDPTAGRGTTLLWGARYGMNARGIERDRKALADFQRHVKKQTKLHRIKHKESSGFTTKKNKDDIGRFLEYRFGDACARLVIGDSKDARHLLNRERFHLIVGDLPYGVQHTGPRGTRNPLDNLKACAPAWADSLLPGGCMVLMFNAFLPRREALVELFEAQGLTVHPMTAAHRMSESILRELAVFTRR